MKPQFTYKSYLFPLLAISLIAISAKIIIANYPIDIFELRWIDYFITALIAVTLIWLVFFEIKRKMILIEIFETHIVTKNLFSTACRTDFKSLTGYKSRVETSRMGNFEELILFGNDNKKIIISELFLKNYKDLKNLIENRLKYYGGTRTNAFYQTWDEEQE